MADLNAFYRIILIDELKLRQRRNPRYSLRAFAAFLGVDNGYLSKLTAGKVLLSLDLADKLAKRLKLSPSARKEFLLSAADEQKCHALYLIDPTLTDCEEELHETNLLPRTQVTKRQN